MSRVKEWSVGCKREECSAVYGVKSGVWLVECTVWSVQWNILTVKFGVLGNECVV